MKITLIIEDNGQTSAHKAGCRDIVKETRSPFAEKLYSGNFNTKREVFEDYNEDFSEEQGQWEVNFKSCCSGLPTK